MRKAFFAIWLLLLAAACQPKESEPSYLRLNGRGSDCLIVLQSDHKQVTVDILCDQPWSCVVDGSVSSWMAFSREKDPVLDNTWHFILDVKAMETGTEAREAAFVFTSGQLTRRLTVRQSPPDPMREVTVPGAYNAPGGDWVCDPLRDQWSCRHYGGNVSFRMINPQEGRVVTVAGLPENYEEGTITTVQYRVMEKGITRTFTRFMNMVVIRHAQGLLWLRADPGVYLILQIPEAS